MSMNFLPKVDNVIFRWAGTPVVKESTKKTVKRLVGHILKYIQDMEEEYSLMSSIPVSTVSEDEEKKFNFETLSLGVNITEEQLRTQTGYFEKSFGQVTASNLIRGINSYVLFGVRNPAGDAFKGLKSEHRETITNLPITWPFRRVVAYEIESTKGIDILIVDPRIFREFDKDIRLIRHVYPSHNENMKFYIERLDEQQKFVALGSSNYWRMFTPQENLTVNVRSSYGRINILIRLRLHMRILNPNGFILIAFA